MGAVIKHQAEDWKKTKWNAIDTDELLVETKKLQKSLHRSCPARCRAGTCTRA